jgi:hypothetical protein
MLVGYRKTHVYQLRYTCQLSIINYQPRGYQFRQEPTMPHLHGMYDLKTQ